MTPIPLCSICKIDRPGEMFDRCCYLHARVICRECFDRWNRMTGDSTTCEIEWFEEPWLELLMSDEEMVSDLRAMEEELR